MTEKIIIRHLNTSFLERKLICYFESENTLKIIFLLNIPLHFVFLKNSFLKTV